MCVAADAATDGLGIRFPAGEARPWLSVDAEDSMVAIIESTADFRSWKELLRGHGSILDVPDLSPKISPYAFYRALFHERTLDDDWKNVLRAKADAFQSPEPPQGKHEPRWVKFVFLRDAPHCVIFQDSTKYAFHYDFAVERLPQFKGYTRAQFDLATLHTNGQQAVLGAVLFAPADNLLEAGIQFVGLEPYPRESIAEWFQTVRAMLGAGPGMQVFYLPTFEQREVAQQHAAWFAERGIPVSSVARWVISDEVYAPGWAIGRLVFVPGNEIAAAYRDGRLRHNDVLLTDAVPAEVPPLAGILSLSPATPNSHVALLAKSFGIPFAYVARPGFAEQVMAWVGHEVLLRAADLYEFSEVTAVPLATALPDEMRSQIDALKVPPQLNLTPKASLGQISLGADALAPADIQYVGGKAANIGILRRSVPTNSPSPAVAFTFDLWDAYLDQMLTNGQTLRNTIAARLQNFTWPPDMAALQTALAEIRDLIRDRTDFSPEQRTNILNVLQSAGFDTGRKIRFRSSTNVEDSDQFVGAGLYDSYSGCLADDLDGDTSGPSQCDPAEPRERGVFRALRRVYASFYNDNAFLERLRHGVDETQVGMSVLVHHSTPDEFEMANGVATLEVRNYGSGSWMITSRLVSQVGAVSVTNPDTAAQPEEVSVVDFSSGSRPFFSVTTRSSLVQLGGTVLNWEQEYDDLYALLKTAAQRWERETGTNSVVTLDFEYKKADPGRLLLKQIRKLPLVDSHTRSNRFLISTTNRYSVFQGEFGNVVANHRLKSYWGLATRHLYLVPSNLTASVFANVEGAWRHGTDAIQFAGPVTNLPNYSFERAADYFADRWRMGTGAEQRIFELRVHDRFDSTPGPLVVLGDHHIDFHIDYAAPLPTVADDDFSITTTTNDVVMLAPVASIDLESKLQQRTLTHREFDISTSYYWPREPGGTSAGYTAPLIAWVGTTIRGLTSTPITLTGEFSQTYRPGHHNISEDYLFDPWLEPGIDPNLLAELAQKNIRAIIVRRGLPATPFIATSTAPKSRQPATMSEDIEDTQFVFWGLDGTFRTMLFPPR